MTTQRLGLITSSMLNRKPPLVDKEKLDFISIMQDTSCHLEIVCNNDWLQIREVSGSVAQPYMVVLVDYDEGTARDIQHFDRIGRALRHLGVVFERETGGRY